MLFLKTKEFIENYSTTVRYGKTGVYPRTKFIHRKAVSHGNTVNYLTIFKTVLLDTTSHVLCIFYTQKY